MEKFKANLTYWLNPLKWTRDITFLVLLALDFQHTYEYMLALQTGPQASEAVPLFGSLFQHLDIPMTNGVFDAMAYAFMVTATIFFASNIWAKQLTHNHKGWMMPTAMVVGVLISALTNAGTMYYAATGTALIPLVFVGITAAVLGGVVTGGLLMFASMDAWEMKARIEKGRITRAKNRAAADELAAARDRKAKYTPNKYKTVKA